MQALDPLTTNERPYRWAEFNAIDQVSSSSAHNFCLRLADTKQIWYSVCYTFAPPPSAISFCAKDQHTSRSLNDHVFFGRARDVSPVTSHDGGSDLESFICTSSSDKQNSWADRARRTKAGLLLWIRLSLSIPSVAIVTCDRRIGRNTCWTWGKICIVAEDGYRDWANLRRCWIDGNVASLRASGWVSIWNLNQRCQGHFI
jgi:hypothetical protein